jgi:hypothetical protein
MLNQPYVMVALAGSKEDTSRNNTNRSEEWINVTSRRFMNDFKSNRSLKNGFSKFRMNQNAMRVIVGSAEHASLTKEMKENVPPKPHKVEACKKKPNKVKRVLMNSQVTTKKFSNKKFEEIINFGLEELKEYHKSPSAFTSAMTLKVKIEQTLVYIKKQVQV